MFPGQLAIDFEYDGRTERLATEIGILIAPRLAPGTPREAARDLATRIAMLAEKRYRDFWEPEEPIRCHSCDQSLGPKERVRVAVCVRCSMEGRSPGSSG